MRHSWAVGLMVGLCVSSALAAPDRTKEFTVCKEFADITRQVFEKRDQGLTPQAQLAEWEKITATTPEPKRAKLRQQIGGVVQYAYSAPAKSTTPKTARTEFFRGCRATAVPVGR